MHSRLQRSRARLAVHCLPRAASPERNHLNDRPVPRNTDGATATRELWSVTTWPRPTARSPRRCSPRSTCQARIRSDLRERCSSPQGMIPRDPSRSPRRKVDAEPAYGAIG